MRGTSYYRLKQTDYDGTTVVFKIVSVTITSKQNTENTIRVSPNPFNESFTAQFELTETQEVLIQLISVNGAIVYAEKIMAYEGKNTYPFSAPAAFKPGTYILRVLNGKGFVLRNTKVICQKVL